MSFDQPPTKDTIQDQSEYDNHGTLIGKAKWIKGGKFGGAMEFDAYGNLWFGTITSSPWQLKEIEHSSSNKEFWSKMSDFQMHVTS